MVNHSEKLDLTFSAISDPTRRAILSQLSLGEKSIMDLASPYSISLPAISKHLGVLEKAGLLIRIKRGRVNYCRLNARPLREAEKWVVFYQRFWNAKLNALEKFLEDSLE